MLAARRAAGLRRLALCSRPATTGSLHNTYYYPSDYHEFVRGSTASSDAASASSCSFSATSGSSLRYSPEEARSSKGFCLRNPLGCSVAAPAIGDAARDST